MLEPSWLGRRVSVRRVVRHGPDGRSLLGDVVGDLVGLDAQTAVLDTREGLVEVPIEAITVARQALPSTAEELALEAVAAHGWRAAEVEPLGGWLLRANGGFTGRANSVLPLRAPGMPLDEALQHAAAWYAARGLPLRLQVPTEARRLLDAELGERGWPASSDVDVLVRRLDVPPFPPPEGRVELAPEPDEAWLTRYRDGGGSGQDARGILTRHDRAVFAAIRDGSEAVAIGRGAIDDGWLGVTAVEVAQAARRTGLARAIMAALVEWGRSHGAVRGYLQVASGNAAALALYERLGYYRHHAYRYRSAP